MYHQYAEKNRAKCSPHFIGRTLALQLQLPFQVGLFSFGLVAAAPDGPSDDESGFDPALG
jgi:hypothetical protein